VVKNASVPELEILVARNLVALILTPAFLIDRDGALTFYNEAAGELLGRHFEERERLTREEWSRIGPVDESGRHVPAEGLPITAALREGRPAHGRFRILTDQGAVLEIEASALPLVADAFRGTLVTFVPVAHGDTDLPLEER
jgi:PAS domain-containing protein